MRNRHRNYDDEAVGRRLADALHADAARVGKPEDAWARFEQQLEIPDTADRYDLPALGRTRPSQQSAWRLALATVATVAAVVGIASAAVTLGPDGADSTHQIASVASAAAPQVRPDSKETAAGSAGVVSDIAADPPRSTATVGSSGVIRVANGNPSVLVSIFEDPLSPQCAEFQQRYGAHIRQQIAQGKLAVRYRMVDFLNAQSPSGTYSTRAYAAMITVAKHDGDMPGVFSAFHLALLSATHQPEVGSASDLSNDDLARLAESVGASQVAQEAIARGEALKLAREGARANSKALIEVTSRLERGPAVPTVIKDGKAISTTQSGWFAELFMLGIDATTNDND